MLRQVYIVHAHNESDQIRQIVGVYTGRTKASKRLENFQYGYVLPYEIDVDIPLNDETD